jgi:hypothetical protein
MSKVCSDTDAELGDLRSLKRVRVDPSDD